MKFDIEGSVFAGGFGGDLTVRFKKGADEGTHRKEISSIGKKSFEFTDENAPAGSVPP